MDFCVRRIVKNNDDEILIVKKASQIQTGHEIEEFLGGKSRTQRIFYQSVSARD